MRFDQEVRPGGYAWWYVDALSEDGQEGLTLIAFVGSVFSPYYAWSGRRDPANHCALNVALYGSKKRWAMTERGRGALKRDEGMLSIGPSALHWDGHALTIDIDEVTAPIPSRLRGQVRLYPEAVVNHPIVLDDVGNHCWWPIAPCARVEVDLDRPKLRWSGTGYFDSNRGDTSLESTFRRWDWSRAATPDGTAVLYDLETRGGEACSLAILFDPERGVVDFAPPPPAALPKTLWRVGRGTRADGPSGAKVLKTLEDGPFYARSILETSLLGHRAEAVHESLSLDRFRNPIIQTFLPWRMPRRFV